MDIEKQKTKIFEELTELEKEVTVLLDRIALCRKDLADVNTVEEALEFDETHDLEEGLKHLTLF